MRKNAFLFVGALALFVFSFYLSSCTEAEAAAMDALSEDHLIYAIDADELLTTMQANGEVFSGLLIGYRNGELVFQKAKTESASIIRVLTTDFPAMTQVYMGSDGLYHPLERTADYQEFAFQQSVFTFAYFNWEAITRLAKRSEKLYLSGAEINFGLSMHLPEVDIPVGEPVSTIKLEGDYLKPDDREMIPGFELPEPKVLLGAPCPPYWDVTGCDDF